MTQQFQIDFIISGFNAALIKTTLAPLDRLKIIFQTQDANVNLRKNKIKFKNILKSFRMIIKQEGVVALWRGNTTNLLRYSLMQSLNFSLNYSLRDLFLENISPRKKQKHFSKIVIFTGGLSGGLSMIICFPLDFIRTRLTSDVAVKNSKR